MPTQLYELLSLSMRPIFLLLLLYLCFRSTLWASHDRMAYNKKMKYLPDAGLVGEVVSLRTGKVYPLAREGTIGSEKRNDIVLKRPKVHPIHCTCQFVEGKGIAVFPYKKNIVLLDGEKVCGKQYALHGSVVNIGDDSLRFRLFEGLNIPYMPSAIQSNSATFIDPNGRKKPLPLGNEVDYPLQGDEPPMGIPRQPDTWQNITWSFAPLPQEMVQEDEDEFLPREEEWR